MLFNVLNMMDLQDVRFTAAVDAMGQELKRWADMPSAKLQEIELEAGIERVITAFSSHLFLGRTLDQDLVDDVFPVPGGLPVYPYFPAALLPPFHRARRTSKHLFQQMQASPNWPMIDEARQRQGLTPTEACGNILVAMTFNASGLANSLLLPFFVLPLLPERGQCLAEDPSLLESTAWELLRMNGPPLKRKLSEDTDVTASNGTKRTIPAGTDCYTHLGMIQRDETLWSNPHQFKADRFSPLPARDLSLKEGASEPLPTLMMGLPLGTIDDDTIQQQSHGCIFSRLMQPLVKEWLSRIVNDFTFVLESNGGLKAPAASDPMAVELPPTLCRGGLKASLDMLPKVETGTRFSAFEFASAAAQDQYAGGGALQHEP